MDSILLRSGMTNFIYLFIYFSGWRMKGNDASADELM